MAVESKRWNEMITFQQESERLLDATLDMDGAAVAAQIEKIHHEYTSVIQYHNENSLSSVLTIAYLSAMQYYFKPIRELLTGRGFADFVFVPKPECRNDYPALIVELKWNQNAQTALQQIREKNYPASILDYTGEILLVGINYDKDSKQHQCLIEKYEQDKTKRPISRRRIARLLMGTFDILQELLQGILPYASAASALFPCVSHFSNTELPLYAAKTIVA